MRDPGEKKGCPRAAEGWGGQGRAGPRRQSAPKSEAERRPETRPPVAGEERGREGGGISRSVGRPPSPSCSSARRMDFRAPDLLDQWLEPPEEVFSAGAFLELGPPCPHAEAPGTPEQGLPGSVSVTAQVGLGCPGAVQARGESGSGVRWHSRTLSFCRAFKRVSPKIF